MTNLWQPIETIPRDRNVEVESLTGVICLAKVKGKAKIKPHKISGVPTIACWRKTTASSSGDLTAVAWREPSEDPNEMVQITRGRLRHLQAIELKYKS